MKRKAMKYKHIAGRVIGSAPNPIRIFSAYPRESGSVRFAVFYEAVEMGFGSDGQSTEPRINGAKWKPSGISVHRAADVEIVLMGSDNIVIVVGVLDAT